MITKLTSARVLLQERLVNYLFMSQTLEQDSKIIFFVSKSLKKLATHFEKNSNKSRPLDLQFKYEYFSKNSKVKYLLM